MAAVAVAAHNICGVLGGIRKHKCTNYQFFFVCHTWERMGNVGKSIDSTKVAVTNSPLFVGREAAALLTLCEKKYFDSTY
jgi:hypothetical protein